MLILVRLYSAVGRHRQSCKGFFELKKTFPVKNATLLYNSIPEPS